MQLQSESKSYEDIGRDKEVKAQEKEASANEALELRSEGKSYEYIGRDKEVKAQEKKA